MPALSSAEALVSPLPEEACVVVDVRLLEAVYSAVQQARSGSALAGSAALPVDGSPVARQVDDSPVRSADCLVALLVDSVASDCLALRLWVDDWAARAQLDVPQLDVPHLDVHSKLADCQADSRADSPEPAVLAARHWAGLQGGPSSLFLGYLAYGDAHSGMLYRAGLIELPLIHSPGQRNDTLTTYGYEGTLAGLNDALAVSPLNPGSLSVTSSTTEVGRSTPRTRSSKRSRKRLSFSFR